MVKDNLIPCNSDVLKRQSYEKMSFFLQKNEAVGMSKRSYMEAVVDGLRTVDAVDVSLISSYQNPENSRVSPSVNGTCEGKERRKIHVRLLLSIDRREPTASAMETVS